MISSHRTYFLASPSLQEELTKVWKTSSEQAILIGRKDLALQTLRVKSKGLINDIKAREETIWTLKEKLKEKAAVSKTDLAEAKARLQVVVAEKKAHLKLGMKDLEFDRKMERDIDGQIRGQVETSVSV